jgi:dipeptidyl aminopeptidase/acylaminoacyl peptidase
MRRIRVRSAAGVLAAAFASVVAAPVAAQQGAISIESLLSAPFPASMSAAPAGGGVAWVQNDRGVRNVWVALPPEYRGRQVTAFASDDGQEIGGIEWTPDAKTLFFVRGGGANRAGEVPNPMSDPAAAEQAIWRVSVGGGTPLRVTAGSGLAVSPHGETFAFTRRGQIWSAPADGSREPTQLANLRGGSGSLRWSPDGARLAFTSSRGDHGFVGVLDPAGKSVKWMAPSVDRDGEPVWSPDGTRLAFLRVPASARLTLFKPVRSARPWSIMVADVATGTARTAWTAERGAGSAFRNVVGDQLMWGAGDRIVFPWERTGWTSLYSVPANGGAATPLTPGQFEVEYVSLTPDRTQVIYNSNQGDIDRRDIWRVPVGGGSAPVAVTTGSDIEWEPVVTSDGGSLAFFRSGARTQARAMIAVANGTPRELASGTMPADYPERALVEPQPVIFTSPDGMKIHAQLFLPAGARAGDKRPAAIFFHGGSRRQMLLGWNYSSYYNNAYAFNQHLASKGYVVLSVNYRSGIGYGMEFREALNYGAAGASEYNDVVGAGRYLANRGDVDPKRIALWGGSYGGFLTAMGLARNSDMFAAGVDFHGVHDWNVGIRTFVPSYNTLENPRDSLLAFRSSPLASLKTWRSPVLVIHGDDDRNVSFGETVTLVEQLREQGVEVEQLVFPDEVHGFLRYASWVRAYNAASDYLDRKLGVKGRAVSSRAP